MCVLLCKLFYIQKKKNNFPTNCLEKYIFLQPGNKKKVKRNFFNNNNNTVCTLYTQYS